MASNSGGDLDYIITHVVLPPQLPQEDDSDFQHDEALLQRCINTLSAFQAHISFQEQGIWASCSNMVKNMLKTKDDSGKLIQEEVEAELNAMEIGDILAFNIQGQNAGLLIWKRSDHISFQSFELSPVTSSVMGTQGRLRRRFPGPAIALGLERLEDPTFRTSLAQLLSKMDIDTSKEVIPVICKAGSKADEIRDTVHPKLVTEMMTGFLRGMGRVQDVVRFNKCTRDDVCWDNTLKPWRRSPLWLLLRVALQSVLMDGENGHTRYKSFMLFFVASILRDAVQYHLPSDQIFMTIAKINRRGLKLAADADSSWMKEVRGVVQQAQHVIEARWHSIESGPVIQHQELGNGFWNPPQLNFKQDTQLSLLKLCPYLTSISNRPSLPQQGTTFQPNCRQRLLGESIFNQGDIIQPGTDLNARLSMLDVEKWVGARLDQWLSSSGSTEAACSQLSSLLRAYIKASSRFSNDNPLEISVRLLTLMEMWVALDKITLKQVPLLAKYSPGFPSGLFDPLLLSQKLQMVRLARVEKYLKQRHRQATYASSLLFEMCNDARCFSAQYFQQSAHHQALKVQIESDASTDRAKKVTEYNQKTNEFEHLMAIYNSLSCEYKPAQDDPYGELHHYWFECERCINKSRADEIYIDVHEWPLPETTLMANVAVFELDVPVIIAEWREITFALQVDVLSPRQAVEPKDLKLYFLHSYDGLCDRFQGPQPRICLASTTKPFVVSHYSTKSIEMTTCDEICVNNGLHYNMWDSTCKEWTPDVVNKCNVQRLCTFQLPLGSFQKLQYAIDGTDHTSNEVLAKQNECPATLTLHEFYAFATLRSGHRLQWRNIARELVSRVLRLNHEETYLLVLQAALTVGREGESEIYRDSHRDLEELEFGYALVSALNDTLGRIEGNWQSAVTLKMIVFLALRLLSLSPHQKLQEACFSFLRRARGVALEWGRSVSQLCHDVQDEDELRSLGMRALEIALICHSTFSVDESHIRAILRTNHDVSGFAECSIVVNDRCPAVTGNLEEPLLMLLRRSERTSHLLEPVLQRCIAANDLGLNQTLSRVWPGYKPGSAWIVLPSPNERWLRTKTSSEDNYSQSKVIHYNILTGTLLVEGKPLTRLPRAYELHPTYCRLLGKKVLEVVESTMHGMIFETRKDLYGNQVHFRMHDSELIIRAQKASQIYEFLPTHALEGDFPNAFIYNFAHCFDIKSGRIEWRPLHEMWKSAENWQMRLDGQNEYILTDSTRMMIDVRSRTANSIFGLLNPLENATNTHISLLCESNELEIQLPRLKLGFSLLDISSPVMSKQFRGMAIDADQSVGTFTGLSNKLVLRQVSSSSSAARCIIVPHGQVTSSKQGDHVDISIHTGSSEHLKYHVYQVDERLGRLTDNGSSLARLFKIYLHATTSHCLVDALTGRTGTEEALNILSGAAVRSFIELQPDEIEILEKISRLTPRRQYYPKDKRVMQQTEWQSSLSPLSQHCRFVQQVADIFSRATSNQLFQEEPLALHELDPRGHALLQGRAQIRDASFQVCEFGAEDYSTEYDQPYASRDAIDDCNRELHVCRIANLVDNWSTDLTTSRDLYSIMKSWNTTIEGQRSAEILSLEFDSKYLESPALVFPEDWCQLHDFLIRSRIERDKYQIMVLLSTMAFAQKANQGLVQTLLSFATTSALRNSPLPDFPEFQLSYGHEPVKKQVIDLPARQGECNATLNRRRMISYEQEKRVRVEAFATALMSQWPTACITTPTTTNHHSYIIADQAMKAAHELFDNWHRNSFLHRHTQQCQAILDRLSSKTPRYGQYQFRCPVHKVIPQKTFVDFSDLTNYAAPRLPELSQDIGSDWVEPEMEVHLDHKKLKKVLRKISEGAVGVYEQQYSQDLRRSFEAMKKVKGMRLNEPIQSQAILRQLLADSEEHLRIIRQTLCLGLKSSLSPLSGCSSMSPRLSTMTILSHLASMKVDSLPPDWKRCYVKFGLAIATLQRARRMLSAVGHNVDLLNEIINVGHRDWDPYSRPEWLLLELENNILIRKEQAQIAQEMMAPTSNSNSVMQLNMGQGKSSVIVPIISAALADTSQLVRVVVLKPLAMQMFRLLVTKLGGLLGRRIVYMPFSRSLRLSVAQAGQIQQAYEECKSDRAILLLQPEHMLSFELMGFEHLASGNAELGTALANTQQWLHVNSRDILDESDEILGVKFELIYTIGVQRAIDFSPERWCIIQNVLSLLTQEALQIQDDHPNGLEIVPSPPGAVPRIRILEPQTSETLLSSIAKKICSQGLPGVTVWGLHESTRKVLLEFLTDPNFPLDHWATLQTSFSEATKNGMLLLKGLLSGGLLRFCFMEKRWRVNFGLDAPRTMLSVPYHGKDTPSPRSEFSHPDIAIILTCLSYYYGTLSDQQVHVAFEALLNIDHAQEEYALWVKDAPFLPGQFKSLDGVNLSNSGQCQRDVFPALRGARSLINFYLSAIVFPTEMKEFPQKLSSSGWDIAREKAHPTTGFSGTNDSRYVLPLSIVQCDLPEQLPTNAAVLNCLLRPENTFLNSMQHAKDGTLDVEAILRTVVALEKPARVILDVGAQVLEMRNEEFAQAWLSLTSAVDVQAVIFFNDRDEICVLSRDGRQENLAISSFANQLDSCLVYLDESHTRGTDLKLPTGYRALVTLSPGLTKDRLVQACMRMRKLGKGQSVIFCGSLEVQRKILSCKGEESSKIKVADVLRWCIATTCTHTKKIIPLWATQGIRHQRRLTITARPKKTEKIAQRLLEDEAQSLQQRYGRGPSDNQIVPIDDSCSSSQLQEIYAKCREFQVFSFEQASLQEEQERELSPENEREQQVELPPQACPLQHSIHDDLQRLVSEGCFLSSSDAFQPAFQFFANTSGNRFFESAAWPDDLLVTKNFVGTVVAEAGEHLDYYLRPVHWMITFKVRDNTRCLILSPYEANHLLPLIRKHQKVVLHVYSARFSTSGRSFEDLVFCTVPQLYHTQFITPLLTLQINLFAGQLYFQKYEDYESFRAFLGLCSSPPEKHMQVANDGFMDPSSRGNSMSNFTISPVPFVRSIMIMRRKGQGISVSHVGRILNGELIMQGVFEGGA